MKERSTRARLSVLVVAVVLLATGWQLGPASAEVPPDYDIPNGHFFTQTNGGAAGGDFTGYAVTNEDGVPFWNEWRRIGGVAGFDAGKPWPTVLRDRQALLDDNPAIKKRYFASADPLTFYGLPASGVVDNGKHVA